MVGGNSSPVHDAAAEADRHARRGEWRAAEVHCGRAISSVEALREREPDELVHVTDLAELRYFHAEILLNLNRVPEAAREARASLELFRALVSIDPIHLADRVRDAESRLGVIEALAADRRVKAAGRVPMARSVAESDPSPEHDLDLARQLARRGLAESGGAEALPFLTEAAAIYGRLRPLGEDDLDLFAGACLRAAEERLARGSHAEAAEFAGDAAQAFGALALRHPERYDRRWYEARELAANARALLT